MRILLYSIVFDKSTSLSHRLFYTSIPGGLFWHDISLTIREAHTNFIVKK
jgi:hypothetical protein